MSRSFIPPYENATSSHQDIDDDDGDGDENVLMLFGAWVTMMIIWRESEIGIYIYEVLHRHRLDWTRRMACMVFFSFVIRWCG